MNEQPQPAPFIGTHPTQTSTKPGTDSTLRDKVDKLARCLLPFGAERVPIVEYYGVPLPPGVLGRVLVAVWRDGRAEVYRVRANGGGGNIGTTEDCDRLAALIRQAIAELQEDADSQKRESIPKTEKAEGEA